MVALSMVPLVLSLLLAINSDVTKAEGGSEDAKNITYPLKIDYLAPFGCAVSRKCDDQGSAFVPAALEVAMERINTLPKWEPFHKAVINFVDSTSNAPKKTRDSTLKKDTVGILGLAQNCLIDTTILNINKRIGISDVCRMDLTSYEGYDRSTVLFNSATDSLSKGVMYLLRKYNWKNVAVVSPSTILDSYNAKTRAQLLELISASGMRILYDSRIDPDMEKSALMARVSNETTYARIIVVMDTTPKATLLRKYLYAMAELGKMQTGAYFVVGFVSYEHNAEWLESPAASLKIDLGDSESNLFNFTSRELELIYRNVLILSDAPPPEGIDTDWDAFRKDVVERTRKKTFCPPYCNDAVVGKDVSPSWSRIKAAVDSLQYLAESGTDAIRRGVDVYNSSTFYEFLLTRTINSIAGVTEYVDGYGNNVGSLQVHYFFRNKQRNNVYSLWAVGRLSQISMFDSAWVLMDYAEKLAVNFINGSPPVDVPACGFYGEFCGPPTNHTFLIAITAAAGILVILLIALFFLYKRYRFEKRLHSLNFLIERDNIILKKHVNLMSQTSLRSMASIQGSFAEPEALKNSTFVLDDFRGNEGTQPATSSQIFGSSLGLQTTQTALPESNESAEDLRWHNLPDFAVGLFEGRAVALKRIYRRDVEFKRNIRREIAQLQELSNPNVIGFIGMVVQAPDVFVVSELAQRGSLKDVLDNDELPLDDLFQNQMTKDIVMGLEYLHQSPIGCHGRLKSTNCLIDSRWMVRLSSFGIREMRGEENPIRDGVQEGKDDLWTAPEMLRWSTGLVQCSPLLVQKADVYSLAIVIYEIFGRSGPWGDEPMEPQEIVNRVKNSNVETKKVFRPNVAVLKDAPPVVQEIVESGWAEDPLNRPSVFQLRRKVRILTAGLKRTIMDNMVAMIEKYTAKLEKDIAERNEELAKEKEKSEMLLQMMLPDVVAESLKRGERVTAEHFESVTVFFSDCPGFADLSASSEPIQIVTFLNDLYTVFDNIITRYDVYKVETIADAYMVASGLPQQNGQNHAGEIASLGLAMLKAVENFEIKHRPGEKVRLRIGINSGSVVAGVIGLKMPRYCLFGDTVNTASRMESNGIPLRINASQTTKTILDDLGGYEIEERGLIEMKGKGKQMTYFVRSEDPIRRRDRIVKERVKYSSLKNAVVDERKPNFD